MPIVGLVLWFATVLGLVVLVRRLRRAPAEGLRALWAGGVAPVVATGLYLFLGQPASHPLVLAAAALAGLLLGALLPGLAGTRSGSRAPGSARQRGIAVAIWATAYAAAALAGLVPVVAAQVVLAVVLSVATGLALGSQLRFQLTARGLPAVATAALGAATLLVITSAGIAAPVEAAHDNGPNGAPGQPDPCVFIVESIWPAKQVADTLERVSGNHDDPIYKTPGFHPAVQCKAQFSFGPGGTDTRSLQAYRFADEFEARDFVQGQHDYAANQMIAVKLGDLGYEGTTPTNPRAFFIFFSVANYVGHVPGVDTDMGGTRAAAGRLEALMKRCIRPIGAAPPPADPACTKGGSNVPVPGTSGGADLVLTVDCGYKQASADSGGGYDLTCTASTQRARADADLSYSWSYTHVSSTGQVTSGNGASTSDRFDRSFGRGAVTVEVSVQDARNRQRGGPASQVVVIDATATLTQALTLGETADPQNVADVVRGMLGGLVPILGSLAAIGATAAGGLLGGKPAPAGTPPPAKPAEPSDDAVAEGAIDLLNVVPDYLPPLTQATIPEWKALAGWPPGQKEHAYFMQTLVKLDDAGLSRAQIMSVLRTEAEAVRSGQRNLDENLAKPGE